MASTEGWFLAGNTQNEEFNKGLKTLIEEMIIHRKFYSPVNPNFLSYLFFHIDSDDWKKQFPKIFSIRPPLPTHRIHYIYNKNVLDWRENIPLGYRILQVDSSLDETSLEIPEDIYEWIESSMEDQKKRGFGCCLVRGKSVVVWVNSDCASGDECEIGIITTETERLKGFGALTVAAAIDQCLSMGYSQIGWHCENHNYGSRGVAEKVGFVKERDYIHYICMFDEAEHLVERGMRSFYDKEYEKAIADFEDALTKGKVPIWMYILAARAYATMSEIEKVLQNFREAQRQGWQNWKPVLQSSEIQQLSDERKILDFLRDLSEITLSK